MAGRRRRVRTIDSSVPDTRSVRDAAFTRCSSHVRSIITCWHSAHGSAPIRPAIRLWAQVRFLCTLLTAQQTHSSCHVDSMLGCFVDPVSPRVLEGWHDYDHANFPMNYDYCAQECYDRNFRLAGLEDGQQCFCGNHMRPSAPTHSTGCKAPCRSNASEICGGDNAINIFTFQCIGPPTPGRPAEPPWLGKISPDLLALELPQVVTVQGTGLNVSHNGSAVCRWEPVGGTSWSARGGAYTSPLVVLNATHGTCTYVPSDDGPVVEGPGVVSISLNGETFSNQLAFTFSASVALALGRFPYIAEPIGQVLLRSDPRFFAGQQFNVSATLPCVNKTWAWHDVDGGSDITLQLDWSGVPVRIHNDIKISIFTSRGTVINRWRRFMRIAPPLSGSAIEPVQLDHVTAGLLVNGVPFMVRGWYVDAMANGTLPSAGGLVALFGRLAKVDLLTNLTITKYGPYPPVVNSFIVDINELSAEEQLHVLDGAALYGVKLILTMNRMGIEGGLLSNESKRWIQANITNVKGHSAVLGYYICGDCNRATDQSKAYSFLKEIDPFHLTFGALNGASSFVFRDVPSAANLSHPGVITASREDEWLDSSTEQQPMLQLSLDCVQKENYATTLAEHAGSGLWNNRTDERYMGPGLGSDGMHRFGMFQEPLVNTNGNWNINQAHGFYPHLATGQYPPTRFRSILWMGVVMANMANQLVFMFGNDPPSYGPWQITESMAAWSAEMEELMPSLYAPFGQRDAVVAIVTDVAHVEQMPLALMSDVRARAWQENPNCVHVVAVNANTSSTARPTITLQGAVDELKVNAGHAARLFDACYEVPLVRSVDGSLNFADFVAPESTNVYRLGSNCTDTTAWRSSFRNY